MNSSKLTLSQKAARTIAPFLYDIFVTREIIIQGAENIPPKGMPCLFEGSHWSNSDPGLFYYAIWKTMGKDYEVLAIAGRVARFPIWGWFVRRYPVELIDRDSEGLSAARYIDKVRQRMTEGLREGRSYLLFPSAGRMMSGVLEECSKRAAEPAVYAGVCVCPFAVVGTDKLMPVKNTRETVKQKGIRGILNRIELPRFVQTVTISFGKPIDFSPIKTDENWNQYLRRLRIEAPNSLDPTTAVMVAIRNISPFEQWGFYRKYPVESPVLLCKYKRRNGTMFCVRTRDIDLEELKRRGIDTICLDVNGTVISLGDKTFEPHQEIVEFVARANRMGFRVCIISNSIHRSKVLSIACKLNIEEKNVVTRGDGDRPKPKRIYDVRTRLGGLWPGKAILIGNNLYTDGKSAKNLQIDFCLVLKP